jgi:hypothetical protein
MSARPTTQTEKVEKQAAPAADDACVLCGWCRCGQNGGS